MHNAGPAGAAAIAGSSTGRLAGACHLLVCPVQGLKVLSPSMGFIQVRRPLSCPQVSCPSIELCVTGKRGPWREITFSAQDEGHRHVLVPPLPTLEVCPHSAAWVPPLSACLSHLSCAPLSSVILHHTSALPAAPGSRRPLQSTLLCRS